MEKKSLTVWKAVGIGITVWLLYILVFSLIQVIGMLVDGSSSTGNRVDDFQQLLGGLGLYTLFHSLESVFGILGALAGRYWRKSALATWIGAVIGVIIAIVLGI